MWSEALSTGHDKENVVKTPFNCKVLKSRMKKNTSDICSSKKRATRDVMLVSHSLRRIVLHHHDGSPEEGTARNAYVSTAKERFLVLLFAPEERAYVSWRTSAVGGHFCDKHMHTISSYAHMEGIRWFLLKNCSSSGTLVLCLCFMHLLGTVRTMMNVWLRKPW